MATTSRVDTIVAYGDSQTEGFSWGNRLPALSSTIKTAIGRGISGQEAGTVAVRQGGITLTTTAEVTIQASTEPVAVPVQASVTPCNIRSSSSRMPVILSGVRGTLNVLAVADTPEGMPTSNRSTGVFPCTFTPDAAPSAAVTVPTGTAAVSQDVADHPEYAQCLHIIWAGGNDAAFAGTTRVTGVVSAAQAMVDRLKTAVDEPKFLVAGRTVYSSEVEGTSGYTTAVAQRDALKAAFPDNAIDIWGHVRDNGLGILGIEPTEEDLTAKAGGAMPPSLTAPDNIHFTTDTREKVLAPFIISELATRGWINTTTEPQEPKMPYTPKTDWKTDDEVDHDHLNTLEQALADAVTGAATATATKETADAAAQGVADLRETKADAATVTAALAGKVNALPETQKNKIYGTGSDGKFTIYNYVASGADANSVAARSSSGNIMISETPAVDGHATSKKYVDTAVGGAKTPAGTREMLDAGTDTTVRAFSAKDIADYVAAKIAELAAPKA